MSDVSRRDVLKFLAAAPLAQFALSALDVERGATLTRDTLLSLAEQGKAYVPKHFSAHEWRTVRLLADMIIPRDARSGSATDAGVPEFMDFMIGERAAMQTWMHAGLTWLDEECGRRFSKDFASCTVTERSALLDDIAWPKKAPPSVADGVKFFSRFRDLTSGGFWSSRMGVQDLAYIGNTALAEWKGCPPAALRKLGVHYPKA